MSEGGQGLTGLGKFVSFILIVGLIGLGVYLLRGSNSQPPVPAPVPVTPDKSQPPNTSSGTALTPPPPSGKLDAKEVVPTKFEVPRFPPPVTYKPKGSVLDVELSEYAGYAGLIVANGGLDGSDDSVIFKKHGIKLKIKLVEEDDWSEFNHGRLAASATTVDVLAVYGRQMAVTVPAQIAFSRGADGIVVRSDINRINQLKGRVLAASQFNEADFFIRFLGQEAGLEVAMLPDLNVAPDPDKVNLIYCQDAEQAAQLFLRDVQGGTNQLAGCISWAPFTDEAVEKSNGKARLLATNRNLLIVADVLVVNKGFGEENPKMVAALVDALMEGNKMVRDNPAAHTATIAKAFKWEPKDVAEELSKIHFSNLPENLAFFAGTIDSAGSYEGIYQSAILAYGSGLIKNPVGAEKFVDLQHIKALDASGAYKDQKIAIAPLKSGKGQVETDPLLSKDIRFFFEPNSSRLDLTGNDRQRNEDMLMTIKKLLQVSPGSTVLLRGHVDDARVPEFRKLGGDQLVRKMSLEAMQLSKDRAEEVRKQLIAKHAIEAKRIDIYGAGWNESINKAQPEQNRRVEVHWFTLE